MILCLKLSVCMLGISIMLLKYLSSNKKQKSIIRLAILVEILLAFNVDWFIMLISEAVLTYFTNKYLAIYKTRYSKLKVQEDILETEEPHVVTKEEFIEQILKSKIS